jgi:hypothetical protein
MSSIRCNVDPQSNRKTMPTGKQNTSEVLEPEKFDVLCGKDKTYAKRDGNKLFRNMIAEWAEPYKKSNTKQEKMRITKKIVHSMESSYGSRFLRLNVAGNYWEEITTQQARDKTSHALRFCAASSSCSRGSKSAENRHRHRRNGSDSTSGSTCSSRTASTVQIESTPSTGQSAEVDLNVEKFLYPRQQQILRALRGDQDCDSTNVETVAATVVTSRFTRGQPPLPMQQQEDKFDTLRSEDLNELLNEPLLENEWDNIESLTTS